MAFREVDPGPLELKPFFRFNAIGDKLKGAFVRYDHVEKTIGNDRKKVHQYTFRGREGEFTHDANFDLHRRLELAGLKPGDLVIAEWTGNIQTPNGLMKVHKLLVDQDRNKPTPAPANEDEDIPF